MVDDREALDRACLAVRRYLENRITEGEAFDDLIDVIERTGRTVTPWDEPRSFAHNDG
jgi:hypothetical protein